MFVKMLCKARMVLAALLGLFMLLGTAAHAADESAAFISARTLMEKQEFKPAIKIIEKAQGNGEDNIDMSLLMSEALAGRVDQVGTLKQLGVAKKIKKSMEHSLTLAPNNLDALEGLVQFHLQAPGIAGGDKKQAALLVEKIMALDALRGHRLGATIAGNAEDFGTAREHLNKAMALAPDDADVYIGLGSIDLLEKKYDQAIANYEKCLERAPDNITCKYQMAKACQIGNVQLEKGKAAFTTIIGSGQDDKNYLAYSHFRLGEIYKQEGDNAAAKKQYELAVQANDIKPAKEALKALK